MWYVLNLPSLHARILSVQKHRWLGSYCPRAIRLPRCFPFSDHLRTTLFSGHLSMFNIFFYCSNNDLVLFPSFFLNRKKHFFLVLFTDTPCGVFFEVVMPLYLHCSVEANVITPQSSSVRCCDGHSLSLFSGVRLRLQSVDNASGQDRF